MKKNQDVIKLFLVSINLDQRGIVFNIVRNLICFITLKV